MDGNYLLLRTCLLGSQSTMLTPDSLLLVKQSTLPRFLCCVFPSFIYSSSLFFYMLLSLSVFILFFLCGFSAFFLILLFLFVYLMLPLLRISVFVPPLFGFILIQIFSLLSYPLQLLHLFLMAHKYLYISSTTFICSPSSYFHSH